MDAQRRPSWIFGALIPAIYLVVELAFNYQLTNTTAETVSDQVLTGLEFWGRVVSGIGLGLLIYRLNFLKLSSKSLALAICLVLGVTGMWNVQRELTEYLVYVADPADKASAVALSVLAPQAAAGNLKTLNGQLIVPRGMTTIEQQSVMAIFPAAALHTENRSQQIDLWLKQAPRHREAMPLTQFTPENAYKNLVIPPIALGLSILFALLNLSLLIAFFVEIFYKKHLIIVRTFIFGLLVAFSLQQPRGLLNAEGYRNSMREGLWQKKPLLAFLVEWSGSASPAWSTVSEVSSRKILFGFSFRKPDWSPI